MPADDVPRRSYPTWRAAIVAAAILAAAVPTRLATTHAAQTASGPSKALVRKGDRVAWIGSSSTRIGVWTGTVEFLLRTRQPGLDLKFGRFSTGGGTFATGLDHLDDWMGVDHPTIVVFNYGGNDAGAGRKGLPKFRADMGQCVARARERGARVALVTPQAADVRKSGLRPAALRTLYAEDMLDYGRERGWRVIDVHHPLDALQKAGEKDDPAFSILKDTIHLTDPAYIAWGFLVYDRMNLPLARSDAVLSADGQVTETENCEVRDVEAGEGTLAFTRLDRVLPILPPGPLPPRLSAPLEAHSRYTLAVTGLAPGRYEVRCEGKAIGVVDAEELDLGVDLNGLLLDGGREAPWKELSEAIWKGKDLDRIGKTRWRFEVVKK